MKRAWFTVFCRKVALLVFAFAIVLILAGCDDDSSPVCGDGTCEVGEVPGSCPEDCPEGFCPEGSPCTSNDDCPSDAVCNPNTCMCFTCAADPPECRTDAECVTLLGDSSAYCHLAFCECALTCPDDSPCSGLPADYACTMVSGAAGTCQDCMCCPDDAECTSNEECEDLYGSRHYCNPHTCRCWECLSASDNCRTDEECQALLGDPGATCVPALCDCAPSCPDDSPCWGLPTDYACTTDSGVSGTCQDCACVPPTCGNGVVDADEECDGGVPPDTCEEICDPDIYDGAVPCGPDPACDRGGCEAGFYCSASCTCEPAANVCGDRYVAHEEGEQCEPFGCTVFTHTDTCPADLPAGHTCTEVPGGIERCALDEFCRTGEVCDPDTCQCIPGPPEPIPLCGNGACDSTLGESCSTCEADCGPCPLPGADGSMCGDGICQPGESGSWCGDCPPPDDEPEPDDEDKDDKKDDDKDKDKKDEDDEPSKKPVCGDGVWEPKLGEECDPPGSICYDSQGAAGDCQKDCTCRGPS